MHDTLAVRSGEPDCVLSIKIIINNTHAEFYQGSGPRRLAEEEALLPEPWWTFVDALWSDTLL